MKQVLITINGPGEISAWLTPLSRALKAQDPAVRIVVCLLPCVYSSGSERKVLDGLDTIDASASVSDSLKLIAFKRYPDGLLRDVDTLVVRLGGDMVLSAWLARRLGAPAFAYTERPNPVLKQFNRIFFNGLHKMPAHIGGVKTEFLGEMMVDASAARRGGLDAPDADSTVVGIFPGSRAYMTEFLLPYYAPAIDILASQRPDLKFYMARSDYVTDEWLRQFPPPPADRDWTAGVVQFKEDSAAQWFETEAGTRIEVRPNTEVFRKMKAALTIPGTNTGEMAAAGIPMVTMLPTYRYVAEQVPLRGIAGHVARIPWLGLKLKTMAAQAALNTNDLLSHANRRAGKRIVPELVGQNLHADIARELLELMNDDTGTLSREIQSTMGEPGAAKRFASEIIGHWNDRQAAPA